MTRQGPALRLSLGGFRRTIDIGCFRRFHGQHLDAIEHQLQLLDDAVQRFRLRAKAMPPKIGKLQLQLLDQQILGTDLRIPLSEKLKQGSAVRSGGCDDLNHRHESYSSSGSS